MDVSLLDGTPPVIPHIVMWNRKRGIEYVISLPTKKQCVTELDPVWQDETRRPNKSPFTSSKQQVASGGIRTCGKS